MSLQTRKLTFAGVIGALYATLTIAITLLGFGMVQFGPIQFRIAEALTIFPFFFPHSVWGLFVGVIIANLFSPYGMLDVFIGSLATLMAALCTMRIGVYARERGNDSIRPKLAACFPPVIINAVMIGALISWYTTDSGGAFWAGLLLHGVRVGAGQLGVLYALGLPLMLVMPRLPFYKSLAELSGKNGDAR